MGYKSIVVIDNDHLDIIKSNPELFVENLLRQLSSYKRTGGGVLCRNLNSSANVATVVHSCHINESPTIKFGDFGATIITL